MPSKRPLRSSNVNTLSQDGATQEKDMSLSDTHTGISERPSKSRHSPSVFLSGGLVQDRLVRVALRTSLLYAFFAALWILFSDKVLIALISDPVLIGRLSTYKGWAFVAVTALLLHGTLRTQLQRSRKQEEARAKAEQSLRDSEAKFSTVFHASPFGITLSTLDDGLLVDVNPTFLKLLGYTPEQVIGRTSEEMGIWVDPSERDRLMKAMRRDGRVQNAEVRVRTSSGEIRTLLASAELITLSGRSHLLSMTHDITERKQVEAALKESESSFRDLADKSVLGISLIQDGVYRYVNSRFAEIHGLSIGEMADHPVMSQMSLLEDSARVREHFQERFAAGSSQLEFRIVAKAGDVRTVLGYLAGTTYRGKPATIGTLLDITKLRHTEEHLRKNEALLSNAMDLARMVHWEYDPATKDLILNDPFYAFYGTSAEREGGYRMPGDEYARRFVHPDDLPGYFQFVARNPVTNAPFNSDFEHRVVRKNGQVRHIIVRTRSLFDASGAPKLYGANQDITSQKEVEEALTWKTAFLEAQVNSSLDGILVIDSRGKTLLRNRAFVNMWKLPQKVVDEHDEKGQWRHALAMVAHPEALRERVRFLLSHPHETARDEVELRDGTILEAYSCPVLGKEDTYYGRIWTYRDITELKRYWAMLENLSATDGLTELPNRRRFDEFLSREWRRAMRDRSCLSLILIDVDFFKEFNDQYGHLAGDDCLRQVAQILKEVVQRPGDLAARYGGDEFACILPETDSAGAVALAARISERMETKNIPHFSSPVADHVTLSFGVATTIPEARQAPSDLIRLADRLLYSAKESGRDQVRSWQRGTKLKRTRAIQQDPPPQTPGDEWHED